MAALGGWIGGGRGGNALGGALYDVGDAYGPGVGKPGCAEEECSRGEAAGAGPGDA